MNKHLWAQVNPHSMAASYRFKVNVWAGLVGDSLVGQYLLPSILTTVNYPFWSRFFPPCLTIFN